MLWDHDKVKTIWEALKTDVEYDWSLKTKKGKEKKSAIRLANILEIDSICNSNMLEGDLSSALELRRTIRSRLLMSDAVSKFKILNWIVSDWGGIRKGEAQVAVWASELDLMSNLEISSFVAKLGTDRISSWSKILAFFDHENHAIYDSRTSIALNCAMMRRNILPKFFMPMAQNSNRRPELAQAKSMIKSRFGSFEFGYFEYLDYLKSVVSLGLAPSLISAERSIFAGARETAKCFLVEFPNITIGRK